MKERNLSYEQKFRKYLYKGGLERYEQICKNINVRPNKRGDEE